MWLDPGTARANRSLAVRSPKYPLTRKSELVRLKKIACLRSIHNSCVQVALARTSVLLRAGLRFLGHPARLGIDLEVQLIFVVDEEVEAVEHLVVRLVAVGDSV